MVERVYDKCNAIARKSPCHDGPTGIPLELVIGGNRPSREFARSASSDKGNVSRRARAVRFGAHSVWLAPPPKPNDGPTLAGVLPPGWTLLEPGENDRYWSRLQTDFGFRAGTRAEFWPAIAEPTPSVTFDLSSIFERDSADFAAGAAAVKAAVWWALSLHPAEPLVVLDWQHPGYRFDPRADAGQNNAFGDWPVTPFPDGDYFAFLTEDFAVGTFGHPWEQSLCVIGAALRDTLGANLRTWLPVLRLDGRPAGEAEHGD